MSESLLHFSEKQFSELALPDRLVLIRKSMAGRIVLTTSFGLEDQLLTHWIAVSGLDIELVTLDTGRLFQETLDVWEATQIRYGITIQTFAPQMQAVQDLVQNQGALGFRRSPEARKLCCKIRKVEPLKRALDGASGWITGLRADQSADRSDLAFFETDKTRDLVKINPLLDWTRERIAAEADRLGVPVNGLHKNGFLSIGCAPCTRAITLGESERAGRWWWEDQSQKECGLHVAADGRLTRSPVAEAAR
jgi:phosphoadenosine phosphosulfate reductase